MRLKGVMEPLNNNSHFNEILASVEKNRYPINLYGLSDSGKSYMIEGIYENIDAPLVVLTHSDMEAKNLYEDLIFYTNDVYYFPNKEVVFYNVDAISGDLRWARLKVIKEMLSNKKKIIVTSIDALATIYTPEKLYKKYTFKLKLNMEIDFKCLSKKLLESGYERVEIVEGKGEFSLRGGILDVFPPTSTYPFRVELFGDQIESIRTFNVESQRSIEKVKTLEIFPAKEIIITEDALSLAKNKILKEFKEVKEKSNNKDNERIKRLEDIINKKYRKLN